MNINITGTIPFAWKLNLLLDTFTFDHLHQKRFQSHTGFLKLSKPSQKYDISCTVRERHEFKLPKEQKALMVIDVFTGHITDVLKQYQDNDILIAHVSKEYEKILPTIRPYHKWILWKVHRMVIIRCSKVIG